MTDGRRHAAATERNRDPIAAVLRRVLPAQGTALEIASGTGQHPRYCAVVLPGLVWQPSERDPAAFDSIVAWAADAPVTNVRPPLLLDVQQPWPVTTVDAIFNANMIHISPWETCEALMRGAGRQLVS